MSSETIFVLTMLGFAIMFILVVRFQARKNGGHLSRANDNSAAILDVQRKSQALLERQVAALERIATALDRGQA